jgi:hypothetical protein
MLPTEVVDEVVDDAAAFNKLVDNLTFYSDIVHTNGPSVMGNLSRAQEIRDEISASPMNIENNTVPRLDQKENFKNIETYCSKEPESIDE